VESEEAEAGHEGKGDQEEPRVAAGARRHAHCVAEPQREQGCAEHQPEVRRVALPSNVGAGYER
jgi:hypothetical protein